MKLNYFWLVIFNLILILSLQPFPVSGSIVWSDDFNDGNYDGWAISGYYFPLVGPWGVTTGEVSVESKVLRIRGNEVFRNFTFATHASTQAYGSWSFDLDLKPVFMSSNHTHVYFIDNRPVENIPDFSSTFCCYDILVSSYPWSYPGVKVPAYAKKVYDLSPAFFLMKRPGVEIMDYYQVDAIEGWYHFDITRDQTGHFRVYINNTLRLDATDNTHAKSLSFYFEAAAGSGLGIDNIVVRDDFINPTNSTEISTSTIADTDKSSEDGLPLSSSLIVTTIIIIMVLNPRRRKSMGEN